MNDWQRLDPRTILIPGTFVLAPAVPTVLIMLVSEASASALLLTSGIWLAIAVAAYGATAVDWRYRHYRVTEERFELRSGLLSRNHRSIPRDRIRSVDLTASILHRMLGVTAVKVGTGQSKSSDDLQLDAVLLATAEELRHGLLNTTAEQPAVEAPTATGTPGTSVELARLKPAWLGYGALTFSLMAVVWGAFASAFKAFDDLLRQWGVFTLIGEEFQHGPLLLIGGFAVVALVAGVLGAVLLSTELWWNFRLTREQGTTLRVQRGLLTNRSISLEERRMRGVEVSEPLLLRWAGGARVNAVATGLGSKKDDKQPDSKALLPPAPRAEAVRVAAAVLREPHAPTEGAALRSHPRAALRRRCTRAVVAVLVGSALAGTAALLGWLSWWAVALIAALLIVAFVALAVDSARALGNALSERYLIIRLGSLLRRTVALRREGIIGFRITQSYFQRRAGLITMSATTAAGNGVYPVRDVDAGDGLLLAEEAVPGLLTPFLVREAQAPQR